MPNIGPLEVAIVVAIALVIFGPKKIPELGRSAGQAFREFKGGISGEDEKEQQRVTAAEEVPAAATASAAPSAATAGAPSAPDDQA